MVRGLQLHLAQETDPKGQENNDLLSKSLCLFFSPFKAPSFTVYTTGKHTCGFYFLPMAESDLYEVDIVI